MMMKANLRVLLVIVAVTLSATCVRANVSLPDVISDGMVLQQNQRVPIWGNADPGEPVTVRFGAQSKSTTASADGEWLIKLDPLKANATPPTITISPRNQIG